MPNSHSKRRPPRQNRLNVLYSGLEDELRAQLMVRRVAHRNAEAKGEASEEVWIDLLTAHLPRRYQVGKGIVIDSQGHESHYIDVIIYDRQYTPLIFNRDGTLYIPAESVYAVMEAKQDLTRAHIEYAGRKAASVRRLRRTSAPIVHAEGRAPPREPFRIIAGIVAYESSWADPFGRSLTNALAALTASQQLDFGIAAEHGYFEVQNSDAPPTVRTYRPTRALAAFIIRLLAHLQGLGTVPAINYGEYSKILKR